jgi:outer membrane biosynthesis protein TonB
MRRSRLGWAGLVSLLLHAALLAWLWERAPSRPVSPPSEAPPLVVDIVTLPPEPPPAPTPQVPKPQAPKPPARPRPPAPAPPPAPLPSEPAAAEEPSSPPAEATPPTASAEDAPLVELTPRPSLLPPTPEEGWSLPNPSEPEKPRGHTLHPGDPSLSPEVLLAEEKARVTERVQTWTEDQLAELRVKNGLVHPYFSGMRASLEKQLENSPLFDEAKLSVVQQLVTSYLEEAQRYGSGHNSGRPVNERAPPTASERLEAVSRGNPAHDQLRAFMAAGERVQQLADSFAELVVIVEMQQALDGQLSSVKVVEPSGNKAFDKYVLEAVPPALVKLTPPPPEAIRGRTKNIRTLWAVEGRVVYLKRLSEMEGEDSLYLAGAAALGVLAGRFEETTGDIYVIDVRNPTFEVRPRLLRLW